MQIKKALLIWLLVYALSCVYHDSANNKQIEVEGNTNQQIEITFDYEQIVSVRAANGQIPSYAQLIRNRFNLQHKKESKMLPEVIRTILLELRTPFTNQYNRIFRIQQQLIAFRSPNHFVVVNETEQAFEIIRQFEVAEITHKQLTIEAIEDTYVIIYLSNEEIILINSNSTLKQKNPFNSTEGFGFIRLFEGNYTHFIGMRDKTAHIISVIQGELSIVKSIDLSEGNKDFEVAAFARGEYAKSRQQIWLVDQNKGVFLMTISSALQLKNQPRAFFAHKDCFSIDTRAQDHAFSVLLTCSQDQMSSFITLLFDNDDIDYPFLLKAGNPQQQSCLPKRYIFYRHNILAQEAESIDIFSPTLAADGSRQYYKNWITFATINSFFIENSPNGTTFVYMIHRETLSKHELIEQPFSLAINTAEPVKETLNFTVAYFCKEQTKREAQICESDFVINLNIHNNIVSYVQYRSVNIAIILILSTTLIALILLCRHKYQAIYQKAFEQFKQLTNPQKCQL